MNLQCSNGLTINNQEGFAPSLCEKLMLSIYCFPWSLAEPRKTVRTIEPYVVTVMYSVQNTTVQYFVQ